jgi:hypothetical protein
MCEAEGPARQTFDLHRHDVLLDAGAQQGLAGLPIGSRDLALAVDLDPIRTALGSHRNRILPAVEQNSVILGDLDARSRELAVDRGLALAQASVRQSGGE